MIVYIATNRVNGKAYIGQTINSLKQRKKEHINTANKGKDNIYFHSAIRKYGRENFDWEILNKCNTIEELNKLEIYFIKKFNTFGGGYNLSTGGRNAIASVEMRKKVSEANKGEKNYMFGKHHSKDAKRKIALIQSIPVVINKEYFESIIKASASLKLHRSTITRRILHKTKWLGYKYI